MNQVLVFVISNLLFIGYFQCFSQSMYHYQNAPGAYLYLNEDYDKYFGIGEMRNDYKDGKWLDVSEKDSTIYRVSYFEDGYSTGEWIIFYPDGKTKRKSLKYDHDHNLVEWCKYWRDIKVVGIYKPEGFSQIELKVFEKQEETMFRTELNEYIKTGNTEYNTHFYNTKYYYEIYYYLDIDKAIESFCKIAQLNSYTYQLKLFYKSGNIRRDVNYENGKALTRTSFFYTNKDILKRKDYFTNEVLNRSEYIDKTGSVKKEKVF
ncbi:MAG: hypothetical protein K8R74_03915 [Bacteroidales bacterium]|nr:hypothetical protein [Bacteroidales bacterium]